MVKKVGRAFLLRVSDGAGGFNAFAGITSKSLSLNNERIDVTTPDPATPEGEMWRETLDGVKSMDLSGDGRLVKDAAETRAFASALAAAGVDDFEIVVPNVGTYSGTFSINSLEFSGDDAASFSISLASTGQVTFVAEV